MEQNIEGFISALNKSHSAKNQADIDNATQSIQQMA